MNAIIFKEPVRLPDNRYVHVVYHTHKLLGSEPCLLLKIRPGRYNTVHNNIAIC